MKTPIFFGTLNILGERRNKIEDKNIFQNYKQFYGNAIEKHKKKFEITIFFSKYEQFMKFPNIILMCEQNLKHVNIFEFPNKF